MSALMQRAARSALVAVLCVVAAAAADSADRTEADWSAVTIAGSVESRPAYGATDHWTRVRAGDAVPPSSAVRTRRGGRATLATPSASLMLHPDTILELPATDGGDGTPQALHDRGSVTYEVRDPAPDALEVVTPYLVARAGGAVFRVDVGEGTASVRSLGGTVAVTSRMDGSAVELVGGQTVRVDAGSKEPLRVRSANPDPLSRAGRRIDDRRETGRSASARPARPEPDAAHR